MNVRGVERSFDWNLFSALCEALEVAKTRTTPYHPFLRNPIYTLDLLHDIDVQPVSCHSPAFGETGQHVNCHVPVYVPPGETLLIKIRNQKGDSVIHHDSLKRCNDRDIPIALRRLQHQFFNQDEEQEESSLGYDVPMFDPDETMPYVEADSDARLLPGYIKLARNFTILQPCWKADGPTTSCKTTCLWNCQGLGPLVIY
jgi:hypothetical protein